MRALHPIVLYIHDVRWRSSQDYGYSSLRKFQKGHVIQCFFVKMRLPKNIIYKIIESYIFYYHDLGPKAIGYIGTVYISPRAGKPSLCNTPHSTEHSLS